MQVKITIVVENSTPMSKGLLGEHGFSALIEKDSHKILFDTGQSGLALMNNLNILGIDPHTLTGVVLSHGHFDHTGGLLALLKGLDKVDVYCHPTAFASRFSVRQNEERQIGLPFSRDTLEANGARFVETPEFREICPGVYVSGRVDRPADWRSGDDKLVVKRGSEFARDPFDDDMSIVIETESGPALLLGCAHTGLKDIFAHMAHKGGWSKFNSVIGGLHLVVSDNERDYEEALALFDRFGARIIAPCHCSGAKAMRFLASRASDRFFECRVGSEFTL